MQYVIPTSNECDAIIDMILEVMESTINKRDQLQGGYIKSATYAKFEKSAAILVMDIANVQRYVDEENLWFDDLKLNKANRDEESKKALIDHYFSGKLSDFFVRTFSLFEDAISRILEAEGFELKYFEDKVKTMKSEGILPERSDRRFCRFYMHVRNTIHSNGFFGVESQTFNDILGEGPFEFCKDQPVDFLSPRRQINWINEIINIFEKIANSCKKSDQLRDNAMMENL